MHTVNPIERGDTRLRSVELARALIIRERGTAMLMLSRKSRESVVIGDHNQFDRLLKVTVMKIGPGRVTLGFEVNESVPLQCEDTWERVLASGGSKENTAV